MRNLDDDLNRAIKAAKDKFDIFYSGPLTENKGMQTIKWERGDVTSFLLFAQNIGVKVVYIYEERGKKNDGRVGSLRSLEVGFIHNGAMHVYRSSGK